MSDPEALRVQRDLHRIRIELDAFRDWWAILLASLAGVAFVLLFVVMPTLPMSLVLDGIITLEPSVVARALGVLALTVATPLLFARPMVAEIVIQPGLVVVSRRRFGALHSTQIPVDEIVSCTAHSQPRRLRIQTADGDYLVAVNNTYDDLQWVVAQIEQARIRGAEPAPEPIPEPLRALLGEQRSQRVDASE